MNDPTPQTLRPTALQGDADALAITWNDGQCFRVRWQVLRDACPCATCRDKRTAALTAQLAAAEKPTDGSSPPPQSSLLSADGLLPVISLEEAAPLRVAAMRSIGNYAYAIHFSDGHTDGIYTFEHLRYLCDATE